MTVLILVGLCIGFLCLIAGGHWMVHSAVAIATRWRVSPMIIGLTLVGFGTSTPELLTSVQAAVSGASGIAVGNVVGSNIANSLLIIGVSALLCPMLINARALRRDGLVLMIVSLIGVVVIVTGVIHRWIGMCLVMLLIGYILITFFVERQQASAAKVRYEEEAATVPVRQAPLWASLLSLIGALGITLLGARLLVSNAVILASGLGVSEAVIGLTVVAIGTSLPELVTSVIAARQGQSDVAFGNVLGSNLFNLMGILGLTALIQPITVPPEIARVDIWIMLAATAVLLGFAWTGKRINRLEGFTLTLGYVLYLLWMVVGNA